MIHIQSWTRTDLGTPIELFASHPLAELKGKKPLLLMGGVHGDEPLGVHLAQQTLEFLKCTEAKCPWILIPCLNMDGYKNNTRVNGRGVDLNRNYPSKSWSPSFEQRRYFPGKEPGSEAEVKGVVSLLHEYEPRVAIHCHSWKPMVVCAGEPGRRDAERLSRSSGYEVVPEIGYPTPGSLSQFGWWDHNIPVICIEEADESAPNSVWPRFKEGMSEIFLDASPR
ncbi:MAG: murein peptide amidase A [Bdellovibrionaceae bacterium]|nr:murein peptide amidase A [Pseudobdellovibrionaceae bacterium]